VNRFLLWLGFRHYYLSTGCLHGNHGYCAGLNGAAGSKRPAVCKFCEAPCRCRCHRRRSTQPALTVRMPERRRDTP
jgi:hypothetical protein